MAGLLYLRAPNPNLDKVIEYICMGAVVIGPAIAIEAVLGRTITSYLLIAGAWICTLLVIGQ